MGLLKQTMHQRAINIQYKSPFFCQAKQQGVIVLNRQTYYY